MVESKRFIGSDMTRLYERVRREFGPDAVIVRTRSLMRENAEPLIEIVAAPADAEPELSLDLQWTMVDGALGRLQIARPRATIGDVEDAIEREAIGQPEPLGRLAEPARYATGQHPGERRPHSFAEASTPEEEDPEPGPRPASPHNVPFEQRVRRRSFAPLDGLPAIDPPLPGWVVGREQVATRPRPAEAGSLTGELIAAGLSELAAGRAGAAADPGRDAASALAAALGRNEPRFPGDGETAVITLQGPPGSGRTTALVRMALDCADAGREVILVAADSSRAAAREQLHAYAEATGLPILDAPDQAALLRAIEDSRAGACVFADLPSAGRTFGRLEGIEHYAYAVLPSTWHYAALAALLRMHPARGLAGCIPTFMDYTAQTPALASILIEQSLGIAFLSTGPDVASGLVAPDFRRMALGILRASTGDTTDGRMLASA